MAQFILARGVQNRSSHGCGSRTIRLLSPMSMALGMLIYDFLFFSFSLPSKHPALENRATHIHAGSFFLGSFSLKITFTAPSRAVPLSQFQIRFVSNAGTRCFSHSGLVHTGGYSGSFCLNTVQIIPTKIATG